LCFIINGEGIRADDKGIEAVQKIPIPDAKRNVFKDFRAYVLISEDSLKIFRL